MIRTPRLLLPLLLAVTVCAQSPGRATLELLHQRLPEVTVRDLPFTQVMDFIADLTRLNIVVRWQTIEDAGIPRDKPLSIHVKNLRLAQVLWLVMNEAGGTDVKLAYRASGTLLVLSTAEDLDREMVTKVYDVSDLLARVRSADRTPAIKPPQGAPDDSNTIFDEPRTRSYPPEPSEVGSTGQTPEMRDLIALIRDTIEPDSWNEHGGLGTIHSYRGLLVIRNTLLVHQRIGGYATESAIAGP